MRSISSVFKKPGHKALIAYIMAGYPSTESTLKTIQLLEKSGADIIEIGIPFSDPLADGATIQNAAFHALNNGITVKKCMEITRSLKGKTNIPLVFMTYYNPILNFGVKEFCKECAASNISGLIIPDLPPDEAAELEQAAVKSGLDLIFLVTPNTLPDRIKLIAEKSHGFIYMVSVTGITGARKDLPSYLASFVKRIRKITDKPLCIGFGISTAEQAASAASLADGVIMGSKIVQLMGQSSSGEKLGRFIKEIRNALDNHKDIRKKKK